MKEKWNERYSEPEYAYGESANEFLKRTLVKFPVGTALFPADGEGRNSVFAASLGWNTFAFDISEQGQQKAKQLSDKKGVSIDYKVGALEQMSYQPNQFDALVLIYAHFPADQKSDCHKKLIKLLKPGGIVIFEAFSKAHLQYRAINPKVGGPDDLDTLFSIEEIKRDFEDFEFLLLKEEEIELQEGKYHNGKGSVIRCIGQKK